MAISTLDGVESIRIVRAAGNLKIIGTDRPAIEIDSGTAPRVTINAGVAEVTLRDNASIAVPAGVTVEVEDLAGNLDVADLATPFVVTRVRGNLHARHIGAISMRDTVGGNVYIKEAGAVDGLKVRGALSVESAGAITFSHVAGGLDCRIDRRRSRDRKDRRRRQPARRACAVHRARDRWTSRNRRRRPCRGRRRRRQGARLEPVGRAADRQNRRQARGRHRRRRGRSRLRRWQRAHRPRRRLAQS